MGRFKAQTSILAILLAVTFVAWGYLLYQHAQMTSQAMSSMWMPPLEPIAWGAMDFALVYFMWTVMMAAMMLPSAIPMILAFARVCRQQNKATYQLTGLFSSAYLGIWLLFSSALTLLQWQMHRLAWLSPMMDNQNTLLATGILFLAGIYQFMPLKNTCLTHCKTPMGFLLNEWQDGTAGAFKMGLKHGANCLGCCWAQMLIMFAVGVMNLLGMALITMLVILEKSMPLEATFISKTVGVVFLAWGAFLLITWNLPAI
jgi:predicted metal-binding membrane protein